MTESTRDRRLSVRYSRQLDDHNIHFPNKPDGRLIYSVFFEKRVVPDVLRGRSVIEPSLAQVLEDRGYDLTTLSFQIDKKVTSSDALTEDMADDRS